MWVVEYGESGCAILFASVGGIGVWDEYCEEERFEVELWCKYIEMMKMLV